MNADIRTVNRSQPMSQVHQQMLEDGLRHVLVVEDDGTMVGTLSDHDILETLGDVASLGLTEQLDHLAPLVAGDVMTSDVEAVEASDDIGVAAEVMLAHQCTCIPVLDGERLVGLLTETDFVRHLAGNGHMET